MDKYKPPKESVGLDSDQRFQAPTRRVKVWDNLCLQFPFANPWRKKDMLRLYFKDDSYMFVDETARVQSNGGLATKAFIAFPIRELEKNWKQVRTRSTITTESRTETESSVEHRKPKAQQCQTAEKVKGSYEKAATNLAQ